MWSDFYDLLLVTEMEQHDVKSARSFFNIKIMHLQVAIKPTLHGYSGNSQPDFVSLRATEWQY